MSITLMIALEIFSNPKDIAIKINEKSDGNFCFGITRGPGHRYKLIATSGQPIASKEEALEMVEKILQIILRSIPEELKKGSSPLSILTDGEEIDESKILSQELIKKIMDELKEKGEVDTHKL